MSASTKVVFEREGASGDNDNGGGQDAIRIRIADDAFDDNAQAPARQATFGGDSAHSRSDGSDEIPDKIRKQVEDANRKAANAAKAARDATAAKHNTEMENLKFKQAFALSEARNTENEMAILRSQMAKAEEEGETAKKLELEDQIADLRSKKERLNANAVELKRQIEAKQKSAPAGGSGDSDGDNSSGGSGGGKRTLNEEEMQASHEWRTKNGWFDNPVTKEDYDKRNLVLNIDDVLLKQGLDPTSPEYYQKMDEKLEAAMPKHSGNGQRQGNGKPPAPVRRNSQASGNSPGEIILTRDDIATMKKLRLDPYDKKVQERFAREKIKTETRFNNDYEIGA